MVNVLFFLNKELIKRIWSRYANNILQAIRYACIYKQNQLFQYNFSSTNTYSTKSFKLFKEHTTQLTAKNI